MKLIIQKLGLKTNRNTLYKWLSILDILKEPAAGAENRHRRQVYLPSIVFESFTNPSFMARLATMRGCGCGR